VAQAAGDTLPAREINYPDRDRLAERFARFLAGA
jgi:hypothetical protein